MQCLVPFLLFLLLVPLSAIHTQASSLEDIQIRGSLRVGMSGDYQPFSLCEGGGSQGQEQCQGLDVDIARLAPLIWDRDAIVTAVQQEITHTNITPAAKRQLGEALWKGAQQPGPKERE